MSHIINNKIYVTTFPFIIVFPFLIRKMSSKAFSLSLSQFAVKVDVNLWSTVRRSTSNYLKMNLSKCERSRIIEERKFNFEMLILFDFGFDFNCENQGKWKFVGIDLGWKTIALGASWWRWNQRFVIHSQRSVFKRITIDVLVDCPNFLSIKLRLKENWWKLKLKFKLLSKFAFHENLRSFVNDLLRKL